MHKRRWLQFTVLLGICVIAVSSPGNTLGISAFAKSQDVPDTKVNNYGVVNVNTVLNVRQDKGTEHDIIGTLPNQAVCYIQSVEDGWAYIRSGDVYGYVSENYLYQDDQAWQIVHETGEENMPVACLTQPLQDENESESQAAEEAAAATITADSLTNAELRQELVTYARQFLGNPYVWGGTSLTDGADCSGYVQSIYAQFGINLPRVSGEQALTGTQIAVDAVNPGDLIFYERDGEIYHVVIYIGDGQVIHASSAAEGIKISEIYYDNAAYGVSLL